MPTMDHADARIVMELAAIEPDGLSRVLGDTGTASPAVEADSSERGDSGALADHLRTCPDCSAEWLRLRQTVAALRITMAETPPPDLRQRTLDRVRADGRLRGAAAPPPIDAEAASGSSPGIASRRRVGGRRRIRLLRGDLRPATWLAGIAAAAVIAVGLTAFVTNSGRDAALGQEQARAQQLAALDASTLQILRAPDVQQVPLVDSANARQGTLLLALGSSQLVVVAQGLAAPTAGHGYWCWLDTAQGYRPLGAMRLANGLAFWTKTGADLSGVTAGTTFVVSLDSASLGPAPDSPVLQGTL